MAVAKAPAKKAPAKKAPVKKAPVKKAPVARAAARKPAAVKAPAEKKITAISERYTKTQILNQISEKTELSRKQVQSVLDELTDIMEGHIKKRACGEFIMPGLFKVVTVKKPARKARKGINPFNGEETTFAAKPASIQVKVRPLKRMKEMAE